MIYYLALLLLLSGDVELNPGPMIDDQPNISLLLQWLEPLVDWKPFGILLPGITQQDITTIEDFAIDTKQSKGALFSKWLKKNATATWRDVLKALTKREEINLLQTINDQLQEHQCTGGANDTSTTSTVPVVSTVSSSVSVIDKPVTSTTSGNPKDILQSHSDKLVHAISVNLYNVTDALYAKDLIPQQTKEDVHVLGVTNNEKSSKLVNVIEKQLEPSLNPEQYLINLCHVLINQQHLTLTDIATSILHQLGQSDVAKPFSSIPDDVQGYADNMRQHYRDQPIVATDWPPKIGKDYFGRLALVEKKESYSTQAKSDWYRIRGQVDKMLELPENKEISVEDVLQPTDSSVSLRVVIDGPPGIGKTTLCRKLLNMWSNGPLVYQQYDLVLYCPLRDSKIAEATTLADLFVRQRYEVPMVTEWFEKRNGEGLLIIFDGWDELSEQLRQSSLAASIIHRKQLDQCSAIVTSRSYASSSLLKMDTLSKHVQVIGFSEKVISTVIIQTLQIDIKLAQELIDAEKKGENNKDFLSAVKLINDLKVRGDIRSLCYIPLVCSMVILVYCKEGGNLPTTLTELYENFILQTIRRHVNKHDINPCTLGSLSSLPSQLAKPLQEMCQLAYTNLANTTMTFHSHQLQLLSEAVKEDYLGLMTTFREFDEEKYQFLHLTIQEFLAAWWIAKHKEKTEEVFKHHFDNDHFRMCLRFVAGLTHLEHESYQQYFNKQQLDLQCKRKPLLNTYLSCFYQNPKIRQTAKVMETFHIYADFDNVPISLFHLLYESRNEKLCRTLANSINKNSLCLHRHRVTQLSLFDWLCLGYFINNSKTEWNHLHLGIIDFHDRELSVFTDELVARNSLQTQCKRLEIWLHKPTAESMRKILEPSIFCNIQECYFELYRGEYVPCHVLLQLLNLPKLMILHLIMEYPTIPTVDDDTYYTDMYTELEKCIAEKVKLLVEMNINYSGTEEITGTLVSVIRGAKRNKTITSLSLSVSVRQKDPPPLPDGEIEQLLKDNSTLKTLLMNISDELLPSSLNIVEVNTPLTTLEIEEKSSKLMVPLLHRIKGLECLILHEPYPWPHLLFLSHSSLNTLNLPLDTAESANKLFAILQTNTTLETLNVEMQKERIYTSSVGTSLQDMLTQNQTLKYFEINNGIPSSFLSFITTGLTRNTSIKHLNVYIPIPSTHEHVTNHFIEAVSKKVNLTELNVNFTLELDQSYISYSEEDKQQKMTRLFYEQGLPAITSMLQSHSTIIKLRIGCTHINGELTKPHWIELVKKLYDTIFKHPSLKYIEFNNNLAAFTHRPLEDTLKDQKKTLIERCKKEQPGKPLPIVDLNLIK
uniref:NACHT domain-containing protein n=3 Tax=Amphimedon queenslandica TaxID=400682 RepID=A0A1X7U9X7_AMPQE